MVESNAVESGPHTEEVVTISVDSLYTQWAVAYDKQLAKGEVRAIVLGNFRDAIDAEPLRQKLISQNLANVRVVRRYVTPYEEPS